MSHDVVARHFDALGSTCELQVVGGSQAALERCEQQVRLAEARFTRFVRDSELSQLNANPGRYTPVSPQMFSMLEAALWAYQESEGLVNVAVLPALMAAGYDRPFIEGLSQPASVVAVQPAPLPEVLALDRPTRSAAVAPGVALDLGGIAKGFLADQLIDELGDDAVCNLGGDLRLRGAGPDGDGWHIALCDRSAVALTEGGVATSGVTRRRWGQGMHHLIDPRTGLPARTDLLEVSVVTDCALRGEVYAKCAVLLGAVGGAAFLEARGVHYAMLPAAASRAA